jgi:hypothetical protein
MSAARICSSERDMSNTDEIVDSVKDRSIRLFQFLRELMASRLATVGDVDEYEEVIWLDDIPHEAGWFAASWNVDERERERHGSTWLSAVKPIIKAPPPVPAVVAPWVNSAEVQDFRRETVPTLKSELIETLKEKEKGEIVERTNVRHLSDSPDVVKVHEIWVNAQWLPWANSARALIPVQEIYGKLFSLYQKQRKLGEAYEVVVGFGLLTWTPNAGKSLRRHLVTAQTEIAFESGRGIISVGPAADGAKLSLEQDMLDVQYRPPNDQIITEQLKEVGEDWWNQNSIEPVLRSWTNFFSSDAQYHHLSSRQSGASLPIVHFAPALILRKRTTRNLIQVYEKIIEQLKGSDASAVPEGILSLVTTLNPVEHVNEDGNGDTVMPSKESEIYFPLPFNEEQRKIVEKLNSHHGVLVQGPPGTGKSQSIANLICHLLAEGKRILITSQTARALESLSSKIPEEVQALCVSLLGNDRKAYEGLENSISGITNRNNHWDGASNAQKIVQLQSQLHDARRKRAQSSADLRTLREAEVVDQQAPFGEYRGKLSAIARRLCDEQPRFSWASDFVGDELRPVPSSNLLEYLALLSREEEINARAVPGIPVEMSAIVTPEGFDGLVLAEQQLKVTLPAHVSTANQRAFELLRAVGGDRLAAIATGCRQIKSGLSKAKTVIHTWGFGACVDILGEKDRAWRMLRSQTIDSISRIEEVARRTNALVVIFPSSVSLAKLRADTASVIQYLEQGGKLRGLFGRPGALKAYSYLLDHVEIDGRAIQGLDTARQLREWVEVRMDLTELQRAWSKIAVVDLDSNLAAVAHFQDLLEPIQDALDL